MRTENIRKIKEDKARAAEQVGLELFLNRIILKLTFAYPEPIQEKRLREQHYREEQREKLKRAIEEVRLQEQARRNMARAEQQISEMTAYERMYGKVSFSYSCMSVCLFGKVSLCNSCCTLPICFPIFLSVCLHVCLFVCLSVCLFLDTQTHDIICSYSASLLTCLQGWP